MAERPEDMWQVLYNFLNKEQSVFSEIYQIVDEFICKEPSLLRPCTRKTLHSRFQDTFLIWLINKLIRYLNESFPKAIHTRNVDMQKRILLSCLLNRPSLFEKLINIYIKSIDELSIYLSPQLEEITVCSFSSSDPCLQQVDPDFRFNEIRIKIENIDQRLDEILQILQHGVDIAFDSHPKMFTESLAYILRALCECCFPAKIACIRYCCSVFNKAYDECQRLNYFYLTTFQYVQQIWEHIRGWIIAQCIDVSDLNEFHSVTMMLFNCFNCSPSNHNKNLLIQCSINILTHLTMSSEDVKEFLNLNELRGCIIKYILVLLDYSNHQIHLHLSQIEGLFKLVYSEPRIFRIFASTLGNLPSNQPELAIILENILKVLSEVVKSVGPECYLEILKEILNTFSYVEHMRMNRNQLQMFRTGIELEQIFSPISVTTLDVFNMPSIWNDKLQTEIVKLATNIEKQKDTFGRAEIIEIIGIILRTKDLSSKLDEKQQISLIDIAQQPLRLLSASDVDRDLCNISIYALSNIPLATHLHGKAGMHLATATSDIIRYMFFVAPAKCSEMCDTILEFAGHFLANNSASRKQMIAQIIPNLMSSNRMEFLHKMLKLLSCTSCHETILIQRIYSKCKNHDANLHHPIRITFRCEKCEILDRAHIESLLTIESAILLCWQEKGPPQARELLAVAKRNLANSLQDAQFCFAFNHFDMKSMAIDKLIMDDDKSRQFHPNVMQSILTATSGEEKEEVLWKFAEIVLRKTLHSLEMGDKQEQMKCLELIRNLTHSKCHDLSNEWLFHFFKMTFFFLIHCQSEVVNEAILCATELCANYGIQPVSLWHWYKRDLMNFIVKLAVHAYLTEGIRLTRSLKSVSKLLGFSCVQEFIFKYYRLLTTMILPYCVKENICKGLIVGISKTTRKSLPTIFMASFLRIYSLIFLTESPEVGNKCIDLLVKCTGSSLHQLMHADVKQTVAEFLIYFNRNPEFVMKAFQCLLLSENSVQNRVVNTSEDFAKFIAERFLGIITYFESCLGEVNFEKSLKEEALYSLGQIMRFVGARHVTQFRFKIIAFLSSVLTLCDASLHKICLKIWNIFLHIVDIEALGPSLSHIVASLQPLLADNTTEVNDIYKFLILNNDSLLGCHIPDLYFIERVEAVLPEIKQCVARQTEVFLKGEKCEPLEKLRFLCKQITNESIQVRIYGLMYLDRFFSNNRCDINNLIMGEIELNPIVETVIENLVAGCMHDDRNLQMASARCLGQLGAVDPSYMPLNYAREQNREFSLSIHTDTFAIMALTELCRANQSQKDTKHVDSFSLAIQEILSMCGVCPRNNKKMNVWEAIPSRMRQIMEPLLTSCYTSSCQENECKEHPIFDSSFCRSYEVWAFAWASRLIGFVQTDDTKHLLKNFKPSIRRDNNTLAIFFPYILLHALHDCNDAQMEKIFEEFQAVFMYSSRGVVSSPGQTETNDVIENISRTCTKLCSEQLDFLHRWIREWLSLNFTTDSVSEGTFSRVKNFLQKFDKVLIAKANYNSGEYARALMYLESHIEDNQNTNLQEYISFLIEIHGQLMDSDSVEGAVHIKKSKLSLSEEILVSRIVDRPQDTMACYEQMLTHTEAIPQDHIKGMINCYLRMEIPETALLITDGLWHRLTQHYTDDYFKECKAELLWRLGRYEDLEELLEDSVVRRKITNWNVQCAEAFLLIRQSPTDSSAALTDFSLQLDKIRTNVLISVRSCSGAKHNPYPEMYDEIVKLHLLTEVDKTKQLIDRVSHEFTIHCRDASELKRQCVSAVGEFFVDWNARLNILQQTVRVIEPILCFRRNLLLETKKLLSSIDSGQPSQIPKVLDCIGQVVDMEIGKLWIRSVQLNCEAGGLQQAHLSIMKAEEYQPKTLFIEKAKLHWQKGDQTKSLKLIEENLELLEQRQGNIRSLPSNDRSIYAEAKFLQATFNAESMNICSDTILSYFKEAVSVVTGNQQSEKCHVHFAQYMEKIWESMSETQKESDKGCSLLFEIMVNYAKSMKFGYDTVYQSLPRLLSIWLDYTSRDESKRTQQSLELCVKMNDLIAKCSGALPTEIFYTAFSQLLSRIGHPSTEVYGVLRTIIISLIEKYPHQSLWMLLPFLKSSHTVRSKRCRAIFTDNRLDNPMFQKLLKDFNLLADRLIELTNVQATATDKPYKVSTLSEQLPKLFKDDKFSRILLPFEKFMQVFLSSASSKMSKSSTKQDTSPFPYGEIYIIGIREDVVVLRSQASPKKITLMCSDGKDYSMMLKPKDDLRKDFRLMEFNALLKRYLHQDSQARQRRLRIRTYAVVPFNEECGLIEWLPNLTSFRAIVNTIYKARNLGLPDRLLKNYALPKTESIENKRKVFVTALLPKYPPVFHEWFKKRFTTPHSWYEARSSYVKTIAVMSMVGYILGLGDRHGENVLFDETNGDAVHVDFNCLFNLGETFAIPEVVPFRLTHNMVYAMGPLGIEGLYRKCCEITMRLLKAQTKILLSVLRPFVYDLISLNRNAAKKSAAEVTDPKAMSNMKRIEERLKGYINRTETNSMPLSTEGQVNYLIEEATKIDNLASMYIGWGAYF